MVMEKGLPANARLSVDRRSGRVYDLLRHEQVAVERTADGLSFDVELGPGGGSVYMIVEQEIADVRIEAPGKVRRGKGAKVEARIVDGAGKPIAAVIPVEVEIFDGEGKPAEFSGYYGASDGELSLELDIAENDLPGDWTIRLTELASGRSVERKLKGR